ncbi:MAG: L,D-transpeptidase, partial [Pseudomonadota bacterium]
MRAAFLDMATARLAIALAVGSAMTAAALAQDAEPLNSDASETPQDEVAPETSETADAQTFEDAFPVMVSNPVDQAEFVPAGPPVAPWAVGAAKDLIGFIEAIGSEGLDPADYDLDALKVATQSGPSVELDELASKNFVWLVEDIRDGRTPMEARKQWFVEDPDRLTYQTADLLKEA